jgi:polyisoprenyl-phosphate glycosyltransferase
MMMAQQSAGVHPTVSVVVPVKNEGPGIDGFLAALGPILAELAVPYEVVMVNDGSSDDTLVRLLAAQRRHPSLVVVDFSRNFGKEAALTAGLAQARGEAVIAMDADLQHPPDMIPQMYRLWCQGYETVLGARQNRADESPGKRLFSSFFYLLFNALADIRLSPAGSDFRLMDRKVVVAFLSLPERCRFNKGLFTWLGFRQTIVTHPVPLRQGGTSRFSFHRLFTFALDAITSFSTLPLRIWSLLGLAVALASLFYGGYVLFKTLIQGVDVPGYASLICTILFLGGLNMMTLGIFGEYLARVFIESKHRPLYVIRQVHRTDDGSGLPERQNS